jgi:hypothetical protein
VNASSSELFYKLLWGFGSFILFLMFVYRFLSEGSLEALANPYFVSLTISFLALLVYVNFAFEVIVDLKKSLEEEKPVWTGLFDFLFFLVFATTSSLALSYFVRAVVYHIFSKVY